MTRIRPGGQGSLVDVSAPCRASVAAKSTPTPNARDTCWIGWPRRLRVPPLGAQACAGIERQVGSQPLPVRPDRRQRCPHRRDHPAGRQLLWWTSQWVAVVRPLEGPVRLHPRRCEELDCDIGLERTGRGPGRRVAAREHVGEIQAPSPRWTAHDQMCLGIRMADYVLTFVTDRAHTSVTSDTPANWTEPSKEQARAVICLFDSGILGSPLRGSLMVSQAIDQFGPQTRRLTASNVRMHR